MFQLLRGKFEGFLKQLEVGEERLHVCGDLAAELNRNKHPQSSAIRETLQGLRYTQSRFLVAWRRKECSHQQQNQRRRVTLHKAVFLFFVCSACWEDLWVVARERQDRLQRAEECHRFYQDLSDALTLIQVS